MSADQRLEEKQFLQPLVDTISLTLGLPASIWLVDEAGEALHIAAAKGLPDDYMHRVTLRLDEPSVGSEAFKSGRTIVVTDIASDERWKYKQEAADVGLRSAMVVPLQVKDRIVGVLDVYDRELRDFSDPEKALIKSLADQVATTQRRVQDLAVLNEVGMLINSELHLSELFEYITQSATQVLDCQHVSIFLVDESGYLVLKTSSAEGITRKRFAPEDGLAGWVLQTGQSALVSDAVNDSRFVPGLSSDIAKRSMLLAPIIVEDEVIGVISSDRDGLDGFDVHDQSLLETLASQAAVAVRNARLFEQETDRAAVLEKLHQIGEQLLSVEMSASGLREVLRQVARSARTVLAADLIDVYQYVEAEDRYILPPVMEGERRVPDVVKEQIFQDDVVVKVVKGGKPLYTSDTQTDRLLSGPFTIERAELPDQRFVVREGILSSAAVPLKAADETVGIMFVNYRTRQDFLPEQRGIIEVLATQAAMAIYNARVYEQIQKRVEALEALNKVGQRLSTVEVTGRGLGRLLRQIARQARRVLGADLVELYRYAPGGQDRVAAHVSAGRKLVDTKQPKRILSDDVAAQVVSLRDPLFALDAQHEPLLSSPFTTAREGMPDRRFVVREQIASTAAIPLLVGDEAVGILFVNYRTPQGFPTEQQELIQLFANQAAVAIRNAQLFQQRETLQEIARDITSVLDKDELLQRTLERSLELLNGEFGSISVFDPKTNRLQFQYAVGKSSDMSVKLGEGLIGTAAHTREPVRVADVSQDPRYKCHVEAARSELDVPMLVGDRLVGVLNAESSRLNAFSEADQHLAEALAAQAAVAFRTTELYEETRARLQERVGDIRALQEIYALIGTAPLESLLKRVAEYAARLTPATYTGVWLLDEQGHELRFGAMNAVEKEPTRSTSHLPLSGTSISAHVVATGETYVCDDVRDDPYYQEWYAEVRSELAAPLRYGDQVIGILDLESTEIGAFTEDHVRLVEVLAGAAAVAIQSARAYEAMQAFTKVMQSLNEVGRTLTSGIRLKQDEILELIYEQAKKLTGAQDMYIALYDEETGMIHFGLATEHGERVHYESRKADMEKRGKTEEIIFTRGFILHRTLAESKAWYGQPGHKEFIGRVQSSYLGVPMVVGEKVLGMIALYDWEREHAYDEQDLQVFSSMASQAAIALDNAELYYDVNRKLEDANRKLERRVEALAALNEVGQTLTSGIRLKQDEILELIYEQAKKLTGAQDMYIALYDEESEMIHFALATEHGERVQIESRKADMERRGKTEEIFFAREPIFHRTSAEAKAWYGQPGRQEFIGHVSLSYLGVPMVVGEKVLGVAAMWDWEQERAYDDQDLQILLSMASQAAIALDNARLYEQARGEAIAAKQLATLGTAMAALRHRINNTFNIIVPNVTRLRKRMDVTDETIAEILDIIERNARYTSEIIARIQEPLREIEVQAVDVNAVLNDVLGKVKERWQADTARAAIAVTLDLDDSIPQIQAPIGQVAEVFRNLAENAYRAMKDGGRLTAASLLVDGSICVRIQDTGPGIPPRVQQRLFAKPVPSREPRGGSGLGLWLNSLMLQSLGGDVKIEHSDSTGTTMLVQIPAPGSGEEVSR